MDNHQNASPEVTFTPHHPESKQVVRKILRTTLLLSVITLIELALGYWIFFLHKNPEHSTGLVLAIKGVIVILSLAKAFYIVSIFMHLGDEIRNMIMTIVVPLLLFVWFIAAFMWDGNSYKNLRNTYDRNHNDKTNEKVTTPKPAEHHEGQKPGAIH
ncbi:MAG: cytochrome C oxidase subunit IV family protein [Chitinophagaceae bacterium]|nr:cytochrome C oxidase subunit IV family protein [Chitinophagaceae bacterium]